MRLDVHPGTYDWISTEDFDTAWMLHSVPRATATRLFADELGIGFNEVRCTVQWLHCVDRYEDGRKVVEWADEMWWPAEKGSSGAWKFWRLEPR